MNEGGWSPTSYDLYAYKTHAFRRSSPYHLSTIAALYGLTPKDPRTASILELGCGDGRNMIPLASLLPKSRWLGIDRARNAIAAGTKVISDLSLTNIALIEADLLDETIPLTSYDYVVVHGLLSWVPEIVRNRIFAIIRDHLSEDGVALLSYNAYPGWHIRMLLRGGVLSYLSSRHFSTPQERVAAARQFLRDYSQVVKSEDNHDATLLKQEAILLSQLPDWLLHHDLLAELNNPFSFNQFNELCQKNHLGFIAEADPSKILPLEFPPQLQSLLSRYSNDSGAQEALLDLYRTRMFRTSLIGRKRRGQEAFAFLEKGYISTKLKSDGGLDVLKGEEIITFTHEGGGRIQAGDQGLKCALHLLSKQWPKWTSYSELKERLRLPPYEIPVTAELLPHLLKCMFANLIEVSYLEPPQPSLRHGSKPLAFPVARVYGQQSPLVPTLRHEEVSLSEDERKVLLLLDGSKSVEEISPASELPQDAVKSALKRFIDLSLLLAERST